MELKPTLNYVTKEGFFKSTDKAKPKKNSPYSSAPHQTPVLVNFAGYTEFNERMKKRGRKPWT
ncbi:hypothetical protein COLO4_25913 [Corchorus olitorius]|uniref:Uncharacterized protein n=1 Tax=Corchorus olitorius TaxID=93759 RepID=A0A1R3HZN2_9ROSI|nr:hypothetical protein COLO4_25913 [Corchorus olitorius]